MDEIIKYNYLEVKELRDKYQAEETKMTARLKKIGNRLQILNHIISENDENKKDWIIELPKSFIAELSDNVDRVSNGEDIIIPWQDLVIKTISKYQIPMTSNLLYHKIRHQVPLLNKDRRFFIKNISAALNILFNQDLLLRIKIEGKKNYLYGYANFFGENGKIKEEYLKQYKLENGEIS